MQIQTGDPTGTGSGGQSCWGTPFRDEYDLRNAAKHDSRGVIAMANKGPSTNGSQFYIAFRPAAHLDKKHTVFGKLVGGEDVLDALESLPVKPGTERPAKQVKITEVVMYVSGPVREKFERHVDLFPVFTDTRIRLRSTSSVSNESANAKRRLTRRARRRRRRKRKTTSTGSA